jgi:predicted DNA-binding transcriptional regulator AlpA
MSAAATTALTQTLRDYLTAADIGALLSVTVPTVRAWAAAGRIPPPIRVGRRCLRWQRATFLEYLAALQANNGGAA